MAGIIKRRKLRREGKARKAPIPAPEFSNSVPVNVHISSFRDGERCAKTLAWALEKATLPERLYFRVLQAVAPGELQCVPHFADRYLTGFCSERRQGGDPADVEACVEGVLRRITFWAIPIKEAQGPVHQRGLLSDFTEYDNPDAFCMDIDSHMDFIHDWDSKTIENWRATGNEFAMLSAYVADIQEDQERKYEGLHIDLCGYSLEYGIPRGKTGGELPHEPWEKPYFTMNYAAGWSFARCHADRLVPADPNLRWIFTGEEVTRAARLWTSGYDLYLPTIVTIFHNYTYHGGAWDWDDTKPAGHNPSVDRVKRLLRLETAPEDLDLEGYDLGTQRTMEQFVEWARMDLGTPKWRAFLKERNLEPPHSSDDSETPHTFCQTLERVPVRDERALWAAARGGYPHAARRSRSPVLVCTPDMGNGARPEPVPVHV